MSDHSPGPWSSGKCGATDLATGKGRETDSYAVSDGGEGYIVATVWGHSLPGPTALANARLIAARPDLLAACKRALKEYQNEDTYGGGRRPVEQLERAIRKAEGAKP